MYLCLIMYSSFSKQSLTVVFVDELVDINITQTKHRTTVSAVAEIFDMQTLMNRTKAKPFNEQYEKAFPFIARCPLGDLRYEAVFFKGNVLR